LKEQPCWEQVKSDCEALIKELDGQCQKFLPGMVKLFSYVTYFRSILQNEKVRGYLMTKHHQLLKNVELTLRDLAEQEKSAGSQVVPLWTVAKARKKLQDLVTLARTTEPQVIGHNKKPLVIVISARRWKAILRRFPQAEELANPKVYIDDMKMPRKRPDIRRFRCLKPAPWLAPVKRID
jgi:prevent-host-death family protein